MQDACPPILAVHLLPTCDAYKPRRDWSIFALRGHRHPGQVLSPHAQILKRPFYGGMEFLRKCFNLTQRQAVNLLLSVLMGVLIILGIYPTPLIGLIARMVTILGPR